MQNADFVIIGSGSAGAAMAYRLSEDGKHTVIVLEFGGSDIGPFVQMPSALAYPMNMERYNWGYMTEPEPHLNNRRMIAPRGRCSDGGRCPSRCGAWPLAAARSKQARWYCRLSVAPRPIWLCLGMRASQPVPTRCT